MAGREKAVAALLDMIETHGAKLLRYCGVSLVNVAVGLSTLAFAHAVLGWSPVASSVTAWVAATMPAYVLSRRWVWQQSGGHSLSGDLLPFWMLAVAGLVMSTLAVATVGAFTDSTVLILAGNLAAYAVVWVVKYVVIDRLVWGTPET